MTFKRTTDRGTIVPAALTTAAPITVDGGVTTPAAYLGQASHAHASTDGQNWCMTCGRPQTDPMTGLMDRWTWTHSATTLLGRLGGGCDPITLLIADLDRFKSINDSAGHTVGDAVLATVAGVIRSETRTGDLWGRYGSYVGDEFVGLLPGASLPGAFCVAERLQRYVAALGVPVVTPVGMQEIRNVSISIGLASHQPGCDLDDTLGRADMALLAAKRGGRHRVCVANEPRHVVARSCGQDRGNEW
jgi:diguanylate cyclase